MAIARMKKIVFLCSGGGGNLRFIYNAISMDWIREAEISAVFTDRACLANDFAESIGVVNKCVDFSVAGQKFLSEELQLISPDLVITNVHKILTEQFVEQFRGKLINLHYSLLPAFGGLVGANAVKAAINHGAKFTGATAHFVDEQVDHGKPIVQVAIPIVSEAENFDDLMNVVFRCGCFALMGAINSCLEETCSQNKIVNVAIMKRTCVFSGALISETDVLKDDAYWHHIAHGIKHKSAH